MTDTPAVRSATPGSAALPVPVHRPAGARFWDDRLQTMSRDELRALQEGRFRDLVERIFRTPVPFFLRKLRAAGVVDPRDLKGLDDLARVPMTTKDELRDSEAAIPPFGDYRFFDAASAVRIGRSTGTTGVPTLILWTRDDIVRDCDLQARGMWRSGLRPGMRVAQSHPGHLYPGGLMIQTYMEYFGCLSVWLPTPRSDAEIIEGIEFLRRVKVDRSMMPYSFHRYAEVAARMGLDAERDLGLAELEPAPPGARAIGEGVPLRTVGAECLGPLGSTCSYKRGAHLAEDVAFLEILHPETGESAPNGSWGRLVATTFGRDSCLLRYDLGEMARVDSTPCECGESLARGWWGGRLRDFVEVDGKQLSVLDVEAVLGQVSEIATPVLQFVVHRPRRPGPLDVVVESSANPANLSSVIERRLRELLDIRSTVSVVEVGTLARAEYKQSRVVERSTAEG